MRLTDLKRPRAVGAPYLIPLKDSAGDEHYELAISGPAPLVKRVFANCDFDWRIEPKASEKDAQKRTQDIWDTHVRANVLAGEAETTASLAKTELKPSKAADSVVVSVRRTQGEGTFWFFAFPGLFVPRGGNIFFTLPPICNATGSVIPLSGDPDLFLSRNGPFTPVVSASVRAGLAIDTVAFGPAICWPWMEFVPWFRINGFRASVTNFVMSGFGVFP
jgi:hypothetical protein